MKLHCLIVLLIALLLTGCGGENMLSSPVPTSPPLSDQGLHFIIPSAGNEIVHIKRLSQGWSDFHPVSWGAAVQRGDLIKPPSGGAITILCADLTIHIIERESGMPCETSQPELYWRDVLIITPMSPANKTPTIVYPRSTRILEDMPLLRWHDSGGNSYTVSIIEAGKPIWRMTGVIGDSILYPDDAPSLEPGTSYLLEVVDETSGISSGQEPIRGLGFEILPDEEIQIIQQKAEVINALPIDNAGREFTLAVYYTGQGIYGKALNTLDAALTIKESPQLWRWRGQILLFMRLNTEAESAFILSFKQAQTIGDWESAAQAQVDLWRITGDRVFLDAAIALYEQLGDEKVIAELEQAR